MTASGKIRTAFTVTGLFLLLVGVGAVILIEHVNGILEQTGFYNLQLEQVGDTTAKMRAQPQNIAQHLARLKDIEQWTRTDQERALVQNARTALETRASSARALESLDQLSAYYRKAALTDHERLVKLHRRAVIGTFVIIIDGVVLLFIVMYLVRYWLLNPVLDVKVAVDAVNEGTIKGPLTLGEAEEFQEIASSLTNVDTKMKDMRDRLEKSERLAMIGEAAAHITNAMHSMLASMRRLAKYERDAGRVDPNAKAAFDYIIGTTDTMDSWIRGIANASRPLELNAAPAQLEPVIRDSLTLLNPRIAEKEIDVHFEPAESFPDVHIDRILFKQALVAVLSNAVDASPEKARLILITESKSNGKATLVIQDEGEGMSDEVRLRAFEPFFTNKTDAIGLGLTTAQKIIKLHNGDIVIESERGKGTRVHIHLPVAAHQTNGETASHPA